MEKIDLFFRITELIVSVSIPILIVALGVILNRKLEDSKNESAKKHHWQIKWTESFFEKYQSYLDVFSQLLASLELLSIYVKGDIHNSPEGDKLQKEINTLGAKAHQTGLALTIQATCIFGAENEITNKIQQVYRSYAEIINNRGGDVPRIYNELQELHIIVGKVFDETLNNK